MFCPNCGNKLEQGMGFCPNCGTKIENVAPVVNNVQPVNNVAPVNNVQPVNNYNQVNNVQPSVSQVKDNKGLISVILGIASLLGSIVFLFLTLPVAIIGLILGLCCKEKGGKKVAGIVLNTISMGLSIALFVLVLFGVIGGFITEEYDGDGYKLEYGFKWSEGKLNGKEALGYFMDGYYFVPIGKSGYDEISCNFEKDSCKDYIRDEFYDMWSYTLNESSLELYKDSSEFEILKDDIYYLSFDYGKSKNDLRGKYYVLVSQEYNVVLSFSANGKEEYLDMFNKDAFALLETIELEKYESDTVDVDDEDDYVDEDDDNIVDDDDDDEDIGGMLESMSNWNRYSSLRQGELGEYAYLTGGWRILADSEQYWEFRGGQFYWYKSVNDLNDNYWNGTYTYYYGKEGLKIAGIDESKMDTIIANSNGLVSSSDVVTVVMTPTKIISAGEDKSATNIPEGTKWTYIWIIVDHGDEGIEGQVLNVDSSSASYFVKIKD